MIWTSLIKPVAALFTKGLDIIDDMVPDKDLAAKLKAALQQKIVEIAHTEFTTLVQSRSQVLLAEIQGKSWLQRNWRPLIMMTFGLIIFNNYALNPWLNALLGWNIIMDIPPDMWSVLKLGLTGYIVGRSAEKISDGSGIKGAIAKVMNGN